MLHLSKMEVLALPVAPEVTRMVKSERMTKMSEM
jgi:hypothetical protein